MKTTSIKINNNHHQENIHWINLDQQDDIFQTDVLEPYLYSQETKETLQYFPQKQCQAELSNIIQTQNHKNTQCYQPESMRNGTPLPG